MRSSLFRATLFLMVFTMLLSIFAGCAQQQPAANSDESASSNSSEQQTQEQQEAPAEGKKVIAALLNRTLGNAYEVKLAEGVQYFADYYNAKGANIEVQILPCDSNNEKQINNLKALCAKKDENTDVIFVTMVNEDPLVAEVAEIAEEAGVYWANLWNLPEGLDPMDYQYWTMHSTPDDFQAGMDISESMINHFETPGKGKMLAILGIVSVSSSIQRYAGLTEVLKKYPEVELLDTQAGDFDPQKAMSLTEAWLAKYDPEEIDAIWAANDDMAVGVVQALKSKGYNGKILVCGVDGTPDAVAAIQAGDMDSTVDAFPVLQAAYSLSYCYAALNGELDVASMTRDEKMFYTRSNFIDNSNVEEVASAIPELNLEDLTYPIVSPMS